MVPRSAKSSISHDKRLFVCVLFCFIKPILGNRYVRSRGFIVSEPRETHPRSEIADVPTSPCPTLPPPHNQIIPETDMLFLMLKLTKFPTPYGGSFTFYYTKHFLNRFVPHVHRARPTHGPRTGSKTVRRLDNLGCPDPHPPP